MINIEKFYKPIPKTVFISGGMSGIGKELVKSFIQAGSNIAIFDIQEDESQLSSFRSLRQSSEQIIEAYYLDIRRSAQVELSFKHAFSQLGSPNLAINSAGILKTALFDELNYDAFNTVIHINLMGSRNFAAAIIPLMKRDAQLVFVSSLAGIIGTYTQSAYAASKFGVVGLAEVLRLELKQKGIDVSVICPGEIDTPMLTHEREYGSDVAKRLNAFAGVLSTEVACKGIIKGLAKRKFMITPGARALFIREFSRKASNLFRKLAEMKLKSELR
jgi:NAD(P)-dependent dehydrogenase (short-subunit alcohol dehydrogenase family)